MAILIAFKEDFKGKKITSQGRTLSNDKMFIPLRGQSNIMA